MSRGVYVWRVSVQEGIMSGGKCPGGTLLEGGGGGGYVLEPLSIY